VVHLRAPELRDAQQAQLSADAARDVEGLAQVRAAAAAIRLRVARGIELAADCERFLAELNATAAACAPANAAQLLMLATVVVARLDGLRPVSGPAPGGNARVPPGWPPPMAGDVLAARYAHGEREMSLSLVHLGGVLVISAKERVARDAQFVPAVTLKLRVADLVRATQPLDASALSQPRALLVRLRDGLVRRVSVSGGALAQARGGLFNLPVDLLLHTLGFLSHRGRRRGSVCAGWFSLPILIRSISHANLTFSHPRVQRCSACRPRVARCETWPAHQCYGDSSLCIASGKRRRRWLRVAGRLTGTASSLALWPWKQSGARESQRRGARVSRLWHERDEPGAQDARDSAGRTTRAHRAHDLRAATRDR
jgi:hypothetical protein